MADVELVIKIPEEDYERCKKRFQMRIGIMGDAIANGILLPKGHDKLIDVKDLLEEICLEDTEQNRELNLGEIITLEDIDRIEAIIEEDKEE